MSRDQEMKKEFKIGRRDFVRLAATAAAGGAAWMAAHPQSDAMVWQLDPAKCISCGNCATYCVLDESAVKCVHNFTMCGYCDLCTGDHKNQDQR